MDKGAVLAIVEQFRRALVEVGVRPQRLTLYGSCARGEAHEWSDIDVVVVSDDFAERGYWERIDLLVEAIYKVRKPIEAVPMTPEEWERGDSLLAQYARQGEEVPGL